MDVPPFPLGCGVREPKMARRLKITQPEVSVSVRRGEQIARETGLSILGK
jgi:hypothetical protein